MPARFGEIKMTEHTAAVAVALLTFLTVLFNSFKQHKIARDTRDINDAVNHRHNKVDGNGNVPPKLYDLVIENHVNITDLQEWKNGYNGSAMSDASSVNSFCDRLAKIEDKQEAILKRPPCMIHDAESKTKSIHPEETKEAD
jgi:hypothetical protein